MKNYEEVTKNVFRKSKEIIARNERRRNIIMTIGASACCLAAVCGVGAIAWNRAHSTVPVEPAAQLVSEEYTNSPGASDTVVPENPAASDGEDVISPELMAFMSHTFVRGFEVEDDEEKVAPDNGQIHISKALQAAMDKYGDADENGEIIYNVVFSYLQDCQTLPSTDKIYDREFERCKGWFSHGLNRFSSNDADGGETEQWIFANLTKSEIENFTADPNYGYVLELHQNYHGYAITEPCTGLEYAGITTKTISGLEVEDAEEKIAPDNGQIHISKALQAAMEQYGDADKNGNKIIYRVVIEYLKDRQTIPATEELYDKECARLKGQTVYGLGFETYSCDWGVHSEHWIHANFTKSQIESFTADPNYGYVIDLYDNYHGYPITDPNDPNHVCFSYEPICGNNSANHENTHHEDDHANQVTNPNNESVHHEDDHANQVTNPNSGSAHHSNHHG